MLQELQKDIDKFKAETQAFVEDVLSNPENRWLREIYAKRGGKDWNRQQTQAAPVITHFRKNNQKRNRDPTRKGYHPLRYLQQQNYTRRTQPSGIGTSGKDE